MNNKCYNKHKSLIDLKNYIIGIKYKEKSNKFDTI